MTLSGQHPQLSLALSGDDQPAPEKPRKQIKPHHRPKSDAPLLPLSQPRFLPVIGVPKTRAECPDTAHTYCPHLRCRWHLALQDAAHRAGRPGLSKAPRDARGLIISQDGDLGEERSTTAEPHWLELERTCKMRVDYDEAGNVIGVEPYHPSAETDLVNWVMHGQWIGTWDEMSAALYVDEPIDVFNDAGVRVCGARLTADGFLALQGAPGGAIVVTLRRARGTESCALDAIQRHGKMGNQAIGDKLHRHRTLVARENKGALMKAIETAEEMGIERGDFYRALLEMGEGK